MSNTTPSPEPLPGQFGQPQGAAEANDSPGPQLPPVPAPPPPWVGPPRYGQYAMGGAPGPYLPPAPPPPPRQPGIVPLRPLGLGDIYGGVLRAVRHNPAATLGLPTLIVALATVAGFLVGLPLARPFASLVEPLFADPQVASGLSTFGFTATSLGDIYGNAVGMLLSLVIAAPLVEGVLSIAISQSALGNRPSAKEVWRRLRPRIASLLIWTLLFIAAVLAASALLSAVLALLVTALAAVSAGLAMFFLVLALLAFIVGIIWAALKVMFVPIIIAVEKSPVRESVRRSFELSKGFFWRILGFYALASLIVSVVGGIVSSPFTMLATALSFGANGSISAAAVLTVLGSVASTLVTSVFTVGVLVLLYVDLRIRRENLAAAMSAAAQ